MAIYVLLFWGDFMANLPNGYIELEYIESTGTQYINTGFIPKYNTRIVFDAQPISVSGWSGLFGNRNANSQTASQAFLAACSSATQFRSDYYGQAKTLNVSTVLTRFTADKNKNVFSVLGKTVTNTASTAQSKIKAYIFCINNSGRAQYFIKARGYSCQVYDNNNLIRDYVPCKNSNSQIGFYDLIEKKFYNNAGTGTFIAGPEVKKNTILVNDNNSLKEIDGKYVKINGVWTEIQNFLFKENGVWKG